MQNTVKVPQEGILQNTVKRYGIDTQKHISLLLKAIDEQNPEAFYTLYHGLKKRGLDFEGEIYDLLFGKGEKRINEK